MISKTQESNGNLFSDNHFIISKLSDYEIWKNIFIIRKSSEK
jgi:hypothetical protein